MPRRSRPTNKTIRPTHLSSSGYVEEYKVFDVHTHPGFEKKDIANRPGFADCWLSNRKWYMDIRASLGAPDPYSQISKISQIPDFSVDTWIKHMDTIKMERMVLCGINSKSDPPANWRWHVPNEYLKKEFIDKHPGRFIGIGGVNYREGPEVAIKQVEDAKKKGFAGFKLFTPHGGPPNDRKKCYPLFERAQQLGLQAHIHTGWESIRGYRIKYCDPLFIDDIATDFPDLKILQLHCGFMYNPMMGIMNASHHPNVYTDTSLGAFPTKMYFKYFWDLEHFRVLESYIPDKVFFGTDFPLSLPVYRALVDHLRLLPLSEVFKKKLLRDNAMKFFLGEED